MWGGRSKGGRFYFYVGLVLVFRILLVLVFYLYKYLNIMDLNIERYVGLWRWLVFRGVCIYRRIYVRYLD